MKYPDYLDLAEFHARRWFTLHGLPAEQLFFTCAGEHGCSTRSARCSANLLERAALRQEVRAEYVAAGITQAFLLASVQGRGAQGEDLGPALIIVTYEQDLPDRSRLIPLVAEGELAPTAMNFPLERVYSPFPNLLARQPEN